MPKILAIHFEMKSRRRKVVHAGPGDTLRLLHTLANVGDVDIVTTTPLDRLHGLFGGQGNAPTPTSWQEAHARWLLVPPMTAPAQTSLLALMLQTAMRTHTLNVADYDPCIHHAFVGTREKRPVLVPSLGMTRERKDRAACSVGTLAVPNVVPAPAGNTIAAFLRTMPTYPARNTPHWFVRDVRKVVAKHTAATNVPWRILWYGFSATDPVERLGLSLRKLPDNEDVMTYSGQSYVTQMQALAACRVAVGVNSGGLDLAAAAGIPVLRLGEFQDGGPPWERKAIRKKYDWGRAYNHFLARATTIGLPTHFEDTSRFRRTHFRASLRVMIEHHASLTNAAHVILPMGVPLDGNAGARAQQLVDYRT